MSKKKPKKKNSQIKIFLNIEKPTSIVPYFLTPENTTQFDPQIKFKKKGFLSPEAKIVIKKKKKKAP
jgi:hypothetical protein